MSPVLDVSTRWGFTQIESIIKDAHQSLVRENSGNLGDFGEQITPSKMVLVEDLLKVLQEIDDATVLLGKTNGLFIHEVDILTASIKYNLRK